MRFFQFIICLLLLSFTLPAVAGPFAKQQLKQAKVREAYTIHIDSLEQRFRDAGAKWNPRGVFLRAFKDEGILEIWAQGNASSGQRVLVWTIPICAASGVLGPKRQEGDYQVPEGFYSINRFNPWSSYHLSMGLNYPNAVDKFRAGSHSPGSAIFIHGDCVTIGCLPLTNTLMEELYIISMLARDKGQSKIPVHIFPCRLNEDSCQEKLDVLSRVNPTLRGFWNRLMPGFFYFENTRTPPEVRALKDGTYLLKTS
jgi:murein L,D-transpeptidase YafK